jgi:DNA-binding response OmpR family regulator
MRLLVVEDRHVMADSIARSLRREGMAVDVAYDGRSALDLAAVNCYQVVVLDRDLPCVHGDEVCRQLAGSSTRILMLTASGTVEDRKAPGYTGMEEEMEELYAEGIAIHGDPE